MPPNHRVAFPLNVVNWVGNPVRRAAYPLDPDALMRAARRQTGLDDFGDVDGFGDRFRATVASLDRVDWSFLGRAGARVNLLWALTNRLRVTHLLKLHPEIAEVELDPPMVILGLFRTGSTFLHNVLAADERMRAGWMWEFGYPAGRKQDPAGDVAWRRKKCARTLKLVDILIPDQGEVHEVTAEQLEEDFFLLENDFSSMKFVVGFGDWQLGRDLLDANLEDSYRYHRLQLQLLSMGQPRRPWLLKCPWHLWNLETFMRVYPNARIVQTHRNVASAIGSQCSLSVRISSRLKRREDLHEAGRFWVEWCRAGLDRGLPVRDALPQSQVFDVRLKDLRAEPAKTLQVLYEHFGIEVDDALMAALRARAEDMPTLQSGVHEYALEDFGLDRDAVRAHFADYCARFGV